MTVAAHWGAMTITGRNPDLSFATPEALAHLRKANLGVEWYLPNAKRRFATTTKATSDLIVSLAELELTFEQILGEINFDVDAQIVVEHFCNEGYGQELASKYVR